MTAEILELNDFRSKPETPVIKATDKFDLKPFSVATKVDGAANDLVAGLLQGLHNLDVDTEAKVQYDRVMMIYDILGDILGDHWTAKDLDNA